MNADMIVTVEPIIDRTHLRWFWTADSAGFCA